MLCLWSMPRSICSRLKDLSATHCIVTLLWSTLHSDGKIDSDDVNACFHKDIQHVCILTVKLMPMMLMPVILVMNSDLSDLHSLPTGTCMCHW